MDCCASRPEKKKEMKNGSDKPDKMSKKEEKMKKQKEADESKLAELESDMKSAKNRFVNSKRFKEMVKSSFESQDIDKSNSLDANEVYIAVLLLYLKIAGVCKGAIPPDREDIEDLIKKFASPNTPGHLDYEHYLMFCQFLCSQIAGRVTIQMLLQMVVAPLLSLVAAEHWEKLMLKYKPDLYKLCTSYVPSEVVVTLFVGIGVSLFVPPLMNLVDKLVLQSASGAKKKHKAV